MRLKSIFENLSTNDAEAFYRDLVWLRNDTREELYSPEFLAMLGGFTPRDTVYPLYVQNDARDALGRCQFSDIHLYMTDNVLVKVDRMSMAHSLEVRSPLLDYRVVEFAAKLPTRFKVNFRNGKIILRNMASRRLPLEIQKKPKLGFSLPAAQWLRGELKAIAQDSIFDKRLEIAGFLRKEKVDRIWNEHQSGRHDHNVTLWGLMMAGLWERSLKKNA